MLKLLAAPLTRVSVHDICYTSSAWKWGRGWRWRGGKTIWRSTEQNFHWRI